MLQSQSSSNTQCLCCLPVLIHTPITAFQSAKSRFRSQKQPGSHPGAVTQPVHSAPWQLSWANTSTDRDLVCLWSSDTSRLTQQGWQDELSWSNVP